MLFRTTGEPKFKVNQMINVHTFISKTGLNKYCNRGEARS